MVEVICTNEFKTWFKSLDFHDQETVEHAAELLENLGIGLGYPHSSSLKESKHALRELRPKQGRSPLRVIYAFDPKRDAVLIIGGDKSDDQKFYERIIGKSERIFEQYLAEQASGLHNEEGDDETA